MSPKNKKVKKQGLSPGTAVYTGDNLNASVLDVFHYSESFFEESKNIPHDESTIKACSTHQATVTWSDVSGLADVAFIEKIGRLFAIHPLVLEDVVQVNQRPKFEDYDNMLFFTLKMISWKEEEQSFDFEHVSFVLSQNHLLSFQERAGGDVFEWVRKRLRNGTGRMRKLNTDYLMFSLLDATVDGYFSALESFSEKIQNLEFQILHNPSEKDVLAINAIRRELTKARKAVVPVREAINTLIKTESPLIDKSIEPFWRDLYDHCLYCIDIIESDRDVINGLMEIYLSSISHRMNEVMKFLTIFSSIFIPLTFVVGVYGMNFDFMPELRWHYGYFTVLGVMFASTTGMVFWFKKKGWL